jgi:DNA-binding transcriptional LysR family regulator
MELRALRYFVTVAEELHFGRAAERLNIVQPAVSQQIARLERELGTRLLDRSPRAVALTDAGERVLAAARDTLAAADRVHQAAGRPARAVRIGTAPGLTARLERGIDALREHNAHFEVILVNLPTIRRFEALRRGELDLALARGPITAPGLRVHPAWSEPLHAVVSTRHPAAGRTTVTLVDLADLTLRLPSRHCDPPLHDAITTALRAAGLKPRLGRPISTTQDTIVEIGSAPDSWTLLPAEQLTEAGSARVRGIPLAPPIPVTGSVITLAHTSPESCVEVAIAAFRDAVAS